jgi:hypothetical protein
MFRRMAFWWKNGKLSNAEDISLSRTAEEHSFIVTGHFKVISQNTLWNTQAEKAVSYQHLFPGQLTDNESHLFHKIACSGSVWCRNVPFSWGLISRLNTVGWHVHRRKNLNRFWAIFSQSWLIWFHGKNILMFFWEVWTRTWLRKAGEKIPISQLIAQVSEWIFHLSVSGSDPVVDWDFFQIICAINDVREAGAQNVVNLLQTRVSSHFSMCVLPIGFFNWRGICVKF